MRRHGAKASAHQIRPSKPDSALFDRDLMIAECSGRDALHLSLSAIRNPKKCDQHPRNPRNAIAIDCKRGHIRGTHTDRKYGIELVMDSALIYCIVNCGLATRKVRLASFRTWGQS